MSKDKGSVSMDLQLPFKEAKELIKLCIKNLQPVMVWGPPGIGKSDMIKEIALEMEREVVDIRASLLTEVDVKGYPYLHEDKKTGKTTMKFSMANEFPSDAESKAIVFLDELPAGLPSTQLALYQYILDRKIGEYESPAGVAVVAAGNRESDRAGTFAMPKPLENRFLHVEVVAQWEPWLEYAISAKVNKHIVSYLNKNRDKLFMFDPNSQGRAFATPRSWLKVSQLLNSDPNMSNASMRNVIASGVGLAVSYEFMAFKDLVDDMPDPMDILDGTIKTIKKVEASIVYAIVTNLLYKLRELLPTGTTPGSTFGQFANEKDELKWHSYANNFFRFLMDNDKVIGPEFVAMAASAGFNTYKLPFNAVKTIEMMSAVKKYKLILEGI